jgi:recombination protein RecR
MAKNLPDSLAKLIEAFGALPGIGEKTAERLAFFIIHADSGYVNRLLQALQAVKNKVKLCSRCFDLTEEPLCRICRDERRDVSKLCVVERPTDLRSIESTGKYHGLYHVLHGTISPMEGSGPEMIKLAELKQRLSQPGQPVHELILATNHTVEGDATTHYIRDFLQELPTPITMTRLASGIPFGGSLVYADHATLAQALAGRQLV